jgi:hypothetical protein
MSAHIRHRMPTRFEPVKERAGEGVRTLDILVGNEMLYH